MTTKKRGCRFLDMIYVVPGGQGMLSLLNSLRGSHSSQARFRSVHEVEHDKPLTPGYIPAYRLAQVSQLHRIINWLACCSARDLSLGPGCWSLPARVGLCLLRVPQRDICGVGEVLRRVC